MIDLEEYHPDDYKIRDIKAAKKEVDDIVNIINMPTDEISLKTREEISKKRSAISGTTSTKGSWNTENRLQRPPDSPLPNGPGKGPYWWMPWTDSLSICLAGLVYIRMVSGILKSLRRLKHSLTGHRSTARKCSIL